MRVLQTSYDGRHFRSRLEARWAVFLNTLALPYEYEREGFDLDGLWYLPDFWLPVQDCWVEIKGQVPTAEEHHKALRLAQFTRKAVYLFEDPVRVPSDTIYPPYAYQYLPASHDVWPGGPTYTWAECPFCLSVTIVQDADASRLPCGCFQQHIPSLSSATPFAISQRQLAPDVYQDRDYLNWWSTKIERLRDSGDSPHLISAYTAAGSARCEYGEHGAPDTAETDRTGEEE